MADWFLVAVVVVMALALLGANVYILVYFTHPDDKNTAYFPKFLIVRDTLSVVCKLFRRFSDCSWQKVQSCYYR